MQKEEVYREAMSRIDARRTAARVEQERRSDEIMRRIPEAVELERQLRSVCMRVFDAADSQDRTARIRNIQQQAAQADAILRQILQKHGYPADYLDVHYSCPVCNDSGFTGGKRCVCLQKEMYAVAAEAMNQESRLSLSSFDTFSLDYYSDLPADEAAAMKRIYQRCRSYAEHFETLSSPSLLMHGGTGLGKTHLSLAIASVLLQRGFSVVYDSAGELLHRLEREHFGKSGSESSEDSMDTVLSCDLLILDDFGTEFDTSFSRAQIYTIINSRMNARRPIILNTNLTTAQLQERYGDRILSRLLTWDFMHFCGKDIRLKKRKGGSI